MSDVNKNEQKGNELATTILSELNGVVTCKLKELKVPLGELRDIFKHLKGHSILGCKTWKEFCEQKLHRTDRAVRMLLAEEDEKRTLAEETSAPSNKKDNAKLPETPEIARSKALAAAIHYLSPFEDEGETLKNKLQELWKELTVRFADKLPKEVA